LITFENGTIPNLYTQILKKILDEGKEVGPRGLKTRELSPVCIESIDPRQRLFGHPNRKEVPIFTYIEGMWILKGEAAPARLVHYVPGMANFVNEKTGVLDGAYGPAIGKQLEQCYDRLIHDPDTRQAIVIINNPLLHTLPTKDYPCTLSFQFLLRNNLLDMIVTMRSQDAWLGLIYDTGEFQWFQEIMAGWLGVQLGRYIHIDGSLHLYERDWDKARKVVEEDYNHNIYDATIIYDARMPKWQFDCTLDTLALWEANCRKRNFESVAFRIPEGKHYAYNYFYENLMTMIMAYNLRLKKNVLSKEASYEYVRSNITDLGRIYEQRWRP